MNTVLVVGAAGRIGRAVVDELLRLGRPVRALVRRPPPTSFPPGVEVVVGDLTDPDSLTPALAGVEAVFLVWADGPATVSAVASSPGTRVNPNGCAWRTDDAEPDRRRSMAAQSHGGAARQH